MIKLRQMMWVVTLFIVMGQAMGFEDVKREFKDEDMKADTYTFGSKATPATAPSQQPQPKIQPAPLPSKTILGPTPSATETK